MAVKNSRLWKRPEDVPYPSIWSRFERTDKQGGTKKFFIQDITEDMYPFIVDHMIEVFSRDEPLAKSIGLYDDVESRSSVMELYSKSLPQKMGIVCFEEDPLVEGKPLLFVGCNLLGVTQKKCEIFDALNFVPRGEQWKKIYRVAIEATKEYDIYKELGVEFYMTALGLSVKASYRGMGIGQELIKARSPLCKACGIPVIMNSFSNIVSQRAAEKAGYENFITVDYADIAKQDPSLIFPGVTSKSMKFLYKRIH